MQGLFRTLASILGWTVVLLVAIQLMVRIVRRFHKFPIPSFLVRLIDNPLRRKIQQPERLVELLDARPGMRILEIGPGSGTYTVAVSDAVGPSGAIITLDIELDVLHGLLARLRANGVSNIHPVRADAHALPFEGGIFQAAYLITVIGEIPDAERGLEAIGDVLAPGGKLMLSEMLFDPDFPLPHTLRRWCQTAGLVPVQQVGNLLAYTSTFERPA